MVYLGKVKKIAEKKLKCKIFLSRLKKKTDFSLYYKDILQEMFINTIYFVCHSQEQKGFREDIQTRKTFQFGHCLKWGGGLPLPEFFCTVFPIGYLSLKEVYFNQTFILGALEVVENFHSEEACVRTEECVAGKNAKNKKNQTNSLKSASANCGGVCL